MKSHSRNLFAREISARSLLSHTAAAAVILSCAATATAQDKVDQLEEIVITGTRIRGIDAPVGSNVIAINADDILKTGLNSTDQLLRSVPQISNIGLDEARTGGSQRAIANLSGCSAMNLRGLGADATLTLLDGRRAPGACGEGRIFDPNTIPSIALQRVEVVADGSSAIYGSDAMTGVVNLITLHEYNGAETRVLYGVADDMHQRQIQQLFGHTFDRGNIVLALEYNDRTNLRATDRPRLYDDTGAFSSVAYPPNIISPAPPSGFADANGNGIYNTGENGRPLNLQSNWAGVDALPSQERMSAYVYGDFKVTDALKLYANGYYSKRSSDRYLAPLALNASQVPAANPYNASGAPVTVSYSFLNDLGGARQTGYEKVSQGTLGAIMQFSHDWQADLYASFGKADDFRTRLGINTPAVNAALGSTSTATAFDPFSNGTNGYPSLDVKRSVLNSFLGYTNLEPVVSLFDSQLKADGPLFSLPGGDVRMAVGSEYQKLRRTQVQFSNTVAGATNVNTFILQVFSPQERKITSGFAELFIPVFGASNALPGLERLSLSAAARYDKYYDTQVGPTLTLLDTDTTNPKFGVTWQPVKDLSVHASYGKSFRAPALGDYSFGAPTIVGNVNISPAVAAAYGVPVGNQRSINIQGGHTLGLKPERSKTWSFGVDYKPEGLQGLDVSATYYNVRFEDQIAIPADLTSLQSVPYVTGLVNATNSFVLPGKGFVIFNPTTAQVQTYLAHGGALTGHVAPGITESSLYGFGSPPTAGQTLPVYALIDSLSNNTGITKTDGIDFSASYTWDTGIGSWTVDDTLTYVLTFKQALVSNLPLTDYLNQINFPLRLRSRAHVGWNLGGWSANAFVNYQNSYDNTTATPTANVASYITLDATFGYDTGDKAGFLSNVSVQLSALNALDKQPPYARVVQSSVATAFQAYDSQNAGPIGRFLTLQVAKRW